MKKRIMTQLQSLLFPTDQKNETINPIIDFCQGHGIEKTKKQQTSRQNKQTNK
jgi:hypothetical protein